MEFAVRVQKVNDDEVSFDLNTYDVDVDDDGRQQDFGHSVIESGVFVGDDEEIKYVATVIDHATEMESLLRLMVSGTITDHVRTRARRIIESIDRRDTKYRMEV